MSNSFTFSKDGVEVFGRSGSSTVAPGTAIRRNGRI